MASIKVKYRPSTVAGQQGAIYYQVLHDRKVRQIPSTYTIYPDEWNEYRSVVIIQSGGQRDCELITIKEQIKCDVERLAEIDRKLYNSGMNYSADDIVDEFNRYLYDYTLFKYMEGEILRLRSKGKLRTSETYGASLRSFKCFREGKDIRLDNITNEVIEEYEAWHIKRGVVPNTVSFYMRILRSVYNRAVAQHVIEDRDPFRNVYTGIERTMKRALPISVIKKIMKLNLGRFPKLAYARDMFMLSFCLRGMSFIDMAFLRKTDIRNGHVTYRRRKTGQMLTIGWTKEMQEILNRYDENPTEYLLPIIRKRNCNEFSAYRNATYQINHNLKKIAEIMGIEFPLTLYVARHSWASAAKTKGIPLSVISEGLGHDSESTTRIYLASLETSVVDRANAIILRSLRE